MSFPLAGGSGTLRNRISEAMERGEPSVMTGTVKSIGECYEDKGKFEMRIGIGEHDSTYVKVTKKVAKGFTVGDKVKVTTTVEKQA